MSTKTILSLAAAGIALAVAAPSFAGLNGTTVALACDIASKEFAGPVKVKNTTAGTLPIGKQITVVVQTATGNESETIVLKKKLLPGHVVSGSNTYQNTGRCAASVFYPKPAMKPRA
ncbi:MAG: hypothetical protein U1F37_17290 [Alphaproteobacteria bacterium]